MCEPYNGWTNRETWAFMLHVNNDEGLQFQAHDAVRTMWRRGAEHYAAEVVQEWAEATFTRAGWEDSFGIPWPSGLADIASDIGSLYRINWQECAESFLAAIAEEAEYADA